MRKLFFSMFLIAIATTSLHAQIQDDNDHSWIHQTITKFFDGFSALDSAMIRQNITNDFILLEDGEVWNMDSIAIHFNQLKDQLKGADLTRINHFDFIETEVKGNSAWVAYNNTAELTLNKVQKMKQQWMESAFLVKSGNDWKIRLLHSTVVKSKNQ